ncbi:putative aconitase subunit 1 [Brevibacterium sanguinis]|uniref:Aconitase subunit 1 n=2 Tax=Brevibacterium TaxID=1696 RepID=A0ABX9GTS2_9MICO|nr:MULTISPECIES: aconitase X catalytic domain-containing protein [Brevibacterium]RBP65073.1 putative aconitase subunit 1 [Brevibacterium sanguinis]RBP71336.1 putative aconitase subunit 1 [Brevibacterium celere]
MAVELSDADEAMLAGADGPAVAMAMRIVVGLAEAKGAERLIDVTSAHIDSCLFHGQSGIDFARRLVDLGGDCRIPTTTNTGSVDLLHPELIRADDEEAAATRDGRELMELYTRLGVAQTWTCAPYQHRPRPAFGEHVAWAESNAIVFANSVLGARTDRYGDFLDICAALTGRAPASGLHLDENRRASVHLDASAITETGDHVFALLGYLTGTIAGSAVPVLSGFDAPEAITEDELKALGAAAASSGGVALFHLVGRTPEAPALAEVCDPESVPVVTLTDGDLRRARDELTHGSGGVDAICLGTPHASLAELLALARELRATGRTALTRPIYINTGRLTMAEFDAHHPDERAVLAEFGVTIVTDTCTYLTPVLDPAVRSVMTNSGKWAHYAPANLGLGVVFGSLSECVAEAVR